MIWINGRRFLELAWPLRRSKGLMQMIVDLTESWIDGAIGPFDIARGRAKSVLLVAAFRATGWSDAVTQAIPINSISMQRHARGVNIHIVDQDAPASVLTQRPEPMLPLTALAPDEGLGCASAVNHFHRCFQQLGALGLYLASWWLQGSSRHQRRSLRFLADADRD